MGGQMSSHLGERVRLLRRELGWGQERLAAQAGVDRRTIQRIEKGNYDPSVPTIEALSRVFGIERNKLIHGFTQQTLREFEADFLCPTCGALLAERSFVDHEYGDVEIEVFECGLMRGWKDRPCPKDPQFPRIEDYELQHSQDGEDRWHCFGLGKTEQARSVEFSPGFGSTKAEAEHRLRHNYVRVKDGWAEAEHQYPFLMTS
jgi:transcriptional regulator with XRE-family HTH domain